MSEENDAQTTPSTKKPRIVRVVSDETLEAWEAQRGEYLKTHPEAALRRQDELVREAIGAAEETPEEAREQMQETPEPKEAPKESLTELTAEEMREKQTPTEAPAAEAVEEKDEAKEENEEEPQEETAEEKEEQEEEESLVEVEKPAAPEKKRPVIKSITEPVLKPEEKGTPKIIEKMNEQASRDVWPTVPQPGTPFNATLEQASKEVRVEEARRLWLQHEEQKKKQLGFFGKLKAAFGFQ